ncbi:olfactory receptor 14A16-like [Protobothrops mucrosquamatus]|uniref:olfactory receptor 14A16-like n=1 Tax=Protobothrops mucrosquamatus TaxID=103944 RepID=UPI0007758429|nr:olfactory receptor 14A16-like [Protobothrops mucrosquamatus]
MIKRTRIANQSTVLEFILMGFSDDCDVRHLHFIMFLFIYLLALTGNLLIILVVFLNHHLHTPMYFFLANLSLTDICLITTTVPKSIAVSLTDNKIITVPGCVAQVFLIVCFTCSEVSLLTIMAYDRYIAICLPLQYSLILNWDACNQMAVTSWVSSLLYASLQTVLTFQLSFCGPNTIGQFFCDIPQLQKISCTDTKVNQIVIWIIGFIVSSFCSGLVFASYVYIISAVLKIQSTEGRCKAFSTCIPHLTVFSLFMATCLFSYMRPKSLSFPIIDLLSAVSYIVVPPLMNPIIYSLRNKNIQAAVWKLTLKKTNKQTNPNLI